MTDPSPWQLTKLHPPIKTMWHVKNNLVCGHSQYVGTVLQNVYGNRMMYWTLHGRYAIFNWQYILYNLPVQVYFIYWLNHHLLVYFCIKFDPSCKCLAGFGLLEISSFCLHFPSLNPAGFYPFTLLFSVYFVFLLLLLWLLIDDP